MSQAKLQKFVAAFSVLLLLTSARLRRQRIQLCLTEQIPESGRLPRVLQANYRACRGASKLANDARHLLAGATTFWIATVDDPTRPVPRYPKYCRHSRATSPEAGRGGANVPELAQPSVRGTLAELSILGTKSPDLAIVRRGTWGGKI